MKRWAWNIFCAFSLLVFAVSMTLWVRSYLVFEYVSYGRLIAPYPHHPDIDLVDWVGCCYSKGTLSLFRETRENAVRNRQVLGWNYHRESPVNLSGYERNGFTMSDVQLLGIALIREREPKTTGYYSCDDLKLPLWLFLIFALPPFLWWRKWRKRNRRGFPVELSESSPANA